MNFSLILVVNYDMKFFFIFYEIWIIVGVNFFNLIFMSDKMFECVNKRVSV